MIKLFQVSLRGFQNISGIYRAGIRSNMSTRGATSLASAPSPLGTRPLSLWVPHGPSGLPPESSSVTYIPEKILITFHRVWTFVGMDFL